MIDPKKNPNQYTVLKELKERELAASRELYEGYFSAILHNLPEMTSSQRGRVGERLEEILHDINLTIGNRKKKPKFEREIAIELRKNTGLTVKKLALKIGTNPAPIFRYESGTSTQLSTHSSAQSKKYLLWLKEQGYNPFEL